MIETLSLSVSASMPISGTSLQSFIDHLLYHPLAESLRRSDSQVVNEIPAEFSLRKDEAKIFPVIKELLAVVLMNARKGNITVRAEKFRDIMILEIEDCNNYNGYALDYSLRSLESLARLAGGHISAKGQQQLVSTVFFSFPNA
ncbi:MAG TPA: hypothetical protein VHN59_16690 [Chitinophagaceae bacterium]|nr:hypothetical protein [Chitinophagaceae bacterium]